MTITRPLPFRSFIAMAATLSALIAAPLPAQDAIVTPAAPVQAATAAPPSIATPVKPAPKTLPVAIVTSAGTITVALEVERAPLTSANFLRYIDQKRLDGSSFYRAFTYPTDPGIGLIQGGARNEPKRILKPVPHEPTSKTGLTHDDGALSMARGVPGSADGDFFIILGKMQGLDANPAANGDNQGYAVFGHVVEGMDVVRAISAMAKNPNLGVGVMKGQMLASPVKILSTRRVAAAK